MLSFNSYKKPFIDLKNRLLDAFGEARLEETAFSVYYNKFSFAAYLGWARIRKAQKILSTNPDKNIVLDFGSGLGVMLPYLTGHYREVIAVDSDPEITRFVIEGLNLKSVRLLKNLSEFDGKNVDTILALDVLEHVEDLRGVFDSLNRITAGGGVWIISGPTENFLYRCARRLARTSGKGHVRSIYDVIKAVPKEMNCEKIFRLPFIIGPLFLVACFRKKVG
jgi:2-polyprenyl-3-methyl-5-hydroxy-6-metoxy-1,4-benzoquinol methylase